MPTGATGRAAAFVDASSGAAARSGVLSPRVTDRPTVVSDPARLQELGERVARALDRFLTTEGPALTAAGTELQPVLDAARSLLLSGGKRLRPVFCYWGWRGTGAPDRESIVTAASSLELLHACALVHDDVMDDSWLRRGRPAAHRTFTALHERSGWSGNGPAFGTQAAILLGDLCLVWADAMMQGSGLDAQALLAAAPVSAAMRVQLLAGQYLDVLGDVTGGGPDAPRGEAAIDRALRIARLKTASYTVSGPLRLGGTLAGSSPGLLAAYEAYGMPLGEAFQLRDDLLGIYGDPQVTGKPAGDDLREGRRTAVVAMAEAHLAPPGRVELGALLGSRLLDEAGVGRCRELIGMSGAVDRIETMISSRARQARAALQAAARDDGLDPAAHEALDALAETVIRRSS